MLSLLFFYTQNIDIMSTKLFDIKIQEIYILAKKRESTGYFMRDLIKYVMD